MGCPDPDVTQALVEGRVSGSERTELLAHAETCEDCRRLVAELVRRTGSSPDTLGHPPARGAYIGPFLVLGPLGAGGMGVVVSAYDPDLDRKVAIKLLRADGGGEGPAATERRARLVREAQAMAKLSHPNIVTVHQVGTSGDQVFVVMEHIDGGTLRAWLAAKTRSWREVREMFERAGRGLAAAHAAGIVHRDFKPENVMVGSDGRVRVTDFGLARASPSPTDSGTVPNPAITAAGTLLGTPRYMAPEQHDGKPVDARADQFAFCVALYEALFGAMPFAGNTAAALAAAVRRGQVRDPKGGECPAWLRRAVLRGLRPDPDERYPGMAELLADLGRDRVVARRRVLLAAALGVAVIAGVAVRAFNPSPDVCAGAEPKLAGIWDPTVRAAVGTRFSATGKPYADETFARVAGRLDSYTAGWAAMHREACLATARGEQSPAALDLRMACLGRRLAETRALTALLATADADVVVRSAQAASSLSDLAGCADVARLAAPVPPAADPRTRAQVEQVRAVLATAEAQFNTGRVREAMLVAAPAFATARMLLYPPLRAEAQLFESQLLAELGDAKAAEVAAREAVLAADAGRHDEIRSDAQTYLVTIVGNRLGRYDEALRLADTAAAAVARLGESPLRSASVDMAVGRVFQEQGKLEDARARFAAALAQRERTLGPDNFEVADSLDGLGTIAVKQAKFEDAVGYQERAVAIAEKTLGPAHPRVAKLLGNLASSLRNQDDLDRAQSVLERALAIQESALGADSLELALTLGQLGALHHDRGERALSRTFFQRGLAIYDRVEPDNLQGVRLLVNLGRVEHEYGNYEVALAAHRRALAVFERVHGPDHASVGDTLAFIGTIHRDMGSYAEAMTYLTRGEAVLEKALGPRHPTVAWVDVDIALTLSRLGRHREAMERARRARDVFVEVHGPDHTFVLMVGENIADILFREGRFGEALAEYERVTAAMEKTLGPTHLFLAGPLTGTGEARLSLRRPSEAIPPLERALALREPTGSVDPAELASTRFALARALWDSGRDRVRSRSLARAARDAVATAGAPAREQLALTEKWLARHAGP